MGQFQTYPVAAQVIPTDILLELDITAGKTKQVSISVLNNIVGNITQNVTGNRLITTSGTLTDQITGDRSIAVNTNKYTHAVTAASGNTVEAIAGTFQRTVTGAANEIFNSTYSINSTGTRTVQVNAGAAYSHTVVSASGNTTEVIAGTFLKTITSVATYTFSSDWSVVVNINKYSHQVTAANGNTTELIAGTESKTVTGISTNAYSAAKTETITGDRTIAVNTNKYTHIVTAASGNTVEAIAGTESKTVTGAATNAYSSTFVQNVTGNRNINVNTNKYTHAVTAASGNTTELIAGTESKTVTGNSQNTYSATYAKDITVDRNDTVGGDSLDVVSGGRQERTTNNRTIAVNTNKYIHQVLGASGNTTETVAGLLVRNITGDQTDNLSATLTENIAGTRLIAVNTNKYTHQAVAASGNVTEVIAGTQTKTVTGNSAENFSGTQIVTVTGNYTLQAARIKTGTSLAAFANNAAAAAGGLVAGDLYYTNVAGDGVVKVVV